MELSLAHANTHILNHFFHTSTWQWIRWTTVAVLSVYWVVSVARILRIRWRRHHPQDAERVDCCDCARRSRGAGASPAAAVNFELGRPLCEACVAAATSEKADADREAQQTRERFELERGRLAARAGGQP